MCNPNDKVIGTLLSMKGCFRIRDLICKDTLKFYTLEHFKEKFQCNINTKAWEVVLKKYEINITECGKKDIIKKKPEYIFG